MKIKKLLPNEVQEKTLGYKDYRKVLKPTLKAMATQCNSPETATDFFIKTDYEFSDMPGKKMGLIIPGKQTGAWLKMAKEEVKNDKKFTLIGKCYITTSESGEHSVVLLPEKGAAKKNLVKRQLVKFALKGMPFGVQLGEDTAADTSESTGEEDQEETVVSDSSATSDSSTTSEDDDILKKKKLMDARMAKMDEEMAKLKTQLKIS